MHLPDLTGRRLPLAAADHPFLVDQPPFGVDPGDEGDRGTAPAAVGAGVARPEPPTRQLADLTETALDLGPWSTHDAPLPSHSVTGRRTVGWTVGDADGVPHATDVVGNTWGTVGNTWGMGGP